MKKLIVAAAALLISVSAFAQFGIIGGLTSSKSNLREAYYDAKNLNQFHAGVTYKISLGKIFAIQPALEYNVKGTKLETVKELSDLNFDLKTGFIELPVQVQAGASLGKLVRLYGVVEPFVGYAVSNEVSWQSIKDTSWDDVKNRFEYGLGLGAGVELFQHVQVSVRYFWNFGDLYSAQIKVKDIVKEIASTKCSGISLSAAILF